MMPLCLPQNTIELLLEVQPSPVQAAADRTDGDAEDFRDFIVIAILDLPQHQNCPVLVAQQGQRPLDGRGPLLTKQSLFRWFRIVERLLPG